MEAFNRMVQHAHEIGADAIIGMRYDATEFSQGATEVLAYGTAVKLRLMMAMEDKKRCQSCGMPIDAAFANLGTERRWSPATEYCTFCFQNGDFTNPELNARRHGANAPLIS